MRRADPRHLIASINRRIETIRDLPGGLERHSALVAALIEAGQLQQALLDEAFERDRHDRLQPQTGSIQAGLHGLSQAVCRSWDSGFSQIAELSPLDGGECLPAEVQVKLPEGFAFYAVYPEAYIEAARRLRLTGTPLVIGLRSIGTTLAPVVAAALGAELAITLRPFGDVYDRQVLVDPDLERHLLTADRHYVVVDEGPGQSGSSFASVRNWLRNRGVADDRIALVPSHAGSPGSAASPDLQKWWHSAQREVADFEERLAELVSIWADQTVERLDEPVRDLSGGGWRSLHYSREEEWPAVVPAWERRKFLVQARGERFLFEFAGLGEVGEEKLAVARSLHVDGLGPEPVGLAHGFLVEPWIEGTPLSGERPIGEIARYIGARARSLAVPSNPGASIGQLIEMSKRNCSLEFGEIELNAVGRWEVESGALAYAVLPVRTDNRMLPHEWLRTTSGKLIKTDALDHHQAHDLIGCQDIAWDIAGTIVEFGLDQQEAGDLVHMVEEAAQRRVDPRLLAFYEEAYLAFRLGQMRLGEWMTGDGQEQVRIRAAGDRYASRLKLLLRERTAATPPRWPVG